MGLFDEIRKLTQPYDEDDEEFFAEESEAAAEPTVVAGKRGYTATARRTLGYREPDSRQDNPFAEDTRPLGREDFYENRERGSASAFNRPSRDFSRQFDIPTDTETYGDERALNVHPTITMQVVMAKPERFDQAAEIAEHLRRRRTVVINLETTNKDVARRLIDFLSGVAYANDGKIKKVAANTYIITPFNVDVMGDLIDELENSGVSFY